MLPLLEPAAQFKRVEYIEWVKRSKRENKKEHARWRKKLPFFASNGMSGQKL